MNRRDFLVVPAGAIAGSLFTGALHGAAADVPWQRKIRRIGQLNMTEHDPVALNVEEWADYWVSLKVDAVLVSVTGILAFYQTKVPFHRKGKYLGTRDFFGDCCAAAKKRGMHVIARMSPDLNWEDAVAAHPEWFQRTAQDKTISYPQDARLFQTCMFTSYMTDYMPAIMREINSLYDVDGLFTNAWPPLGRMPVCYCAQCRQLPRPGTIEYWDKFNERTMYLWKLYDSIAKEKKKENFYFANLGGGVGSTANLTQLGEVCEWFQCDNQGRGGDETPIWGCAMQGRVCSAVQKGKMATNVTAAWSTGPVRWRNISKSVAEDRIWLDQTLASGMVPYNHIVGGETGMGEDRRLLEPVREYFQWTARHDAHFATKRSIANIGVVMGQRTHLFYNPPRGATMGEFMNGMYYALIEGRFFFDFVHEEKLDLDEIRKYAALILPNTALLSDAQCDQLREYVRQGGSLLATFETGLYDERNRKRSEFGLADVFGIRKTGDVVGTNGNAYSARIDGAHDILTGFRDTHVIAGSEYRVPVASSDKQVLSVVPGFVAYPPELAYPDPSHTSEPAVVVKETAKSRLVWFPGDIERTMWRSGHTDLSRLLRNSIRWVSGQDAPPVAVDGDGVIETFAWETQGGFAVHILNYTNPGMHRGWLRDFYPIGAQKVRMKLPAASKVSRVELLRAEKDVPFHVEKGAITFVVPKVVDYEVAAIHAS